MLERSGLRSLLNKYPMIRVALVDDYANLRDALKNFLLYLENDICVVLEASNGKDFLDRLFTCCTKPDVVLMDVQMPVMDGYDATRYLAEHYPYIKVVGMSADSDEGVSQKMLDCGAARFLPKGVDADKIVEAIYAVAS